MATYGYAFKRMLLNVSQFDLSDGTEVTITAINDSDSTTYGPYTGQLPPFILVLDASFVIVHIDGFAPMIPRRGVVLHYQGINITEVTPNMDYVEPSYALTGANVTVFTAGPWIFSPNDYCPSSDNCDVNITLNGIPCPLYGIEHFGKSGLAVFSVPLNIPLGIYTVQLCSAYLNKCLKYDDSFSIIDHFSVTSVMPLVVPRTGRVHVRVIYAS